MSDYLDDVFGPTGFLAQRFTGYTPRAGQVALARAVDAAISDKAHLLAEAPTGTGKSLAYSVPAIHHAYHTGNRVMIVTANIALQEQLVRKDLPLLHEILPWPFEYALLKGRSNYVCKDRVFNGVRDPVHPQDLERNKEVNAWARSTTTGDVSELPFEPGARLWGRFSISADDCTGEDCEFFNECWAERAKQRAKDAHVVVTNYHLFFADLQVRIASEGNASVLPPYDVVIMDEGHKAVDIARDFFGGRLTEGSVRWVSGMLPTKQLQNDLLFAAESFFYHLAALKKSPAYKARLKTPGAVQGWEKFSTALDNACRIYNTEVRKLLLGDDGPREMSKEERRRMRKLASRLRRADQAKLLLDRAMAAETLYGEVYFIEEDDGRAALCSKPLSVAPILKDHLFGEVRSATVTSATLVARRSFDYVAKDIGVPAPRVLIAESPFNWWEQLLLITPTDVPDPNAKTFQQVAAEKCARAVELARGRTLGLFTSHAGLNVAHAKVAELGARLGYRVYKQGDMPRTMLIEEFKKDTHSVLLGTESFWAGVDVPGESLSCVFIDKLPFTTPEDPIMDALTERDDDWFMKYSVPKAIIALKQGFGRLIRTTTDRGVVVLLDRRISTKLYGRHFLESLPRVRRSGNIEDVGVFLDGDLTKLSPPPGGGVNITQARSLFDR